MSERCGQCGGHKESSIHFVNDPNPEIRFGAHEWISDDYVAWLRFDNGTIKVCDSDSPKAFRVYRRPSGPQTELAAANQQIKYEQDRNYNNVAMADLQIKELQQRIAELEAVPMTDYEREQSETEQPSRRQLETALAAARQHLKDAQCWCSAHGGLFYGKVCPMCYTQAQQRIEELTRNWKAEGDYGKEVEAQRDQLAEALRDSLLALTENKYVPGDVDAGWAEKVNAARIEKAVCILRAALANLPPADSEHDIVCPDCHSLIHCKEPLKGRR